MTTHFKIEWYNEANGDSMVTRYAYDGLTHQKGYTFHGWLCRCIASGKREGFTYRGYRKGL